MKNFQISKFHILQIYKSWLYLIHILNEVTEINIILLYVKHIVKELKILSFETRVDI